MTRCLEISDSVHVKLALEKFRVWFVSNRHEYPRTWKGTFLPGYQIAKTYAGHAFFVSAEYLFDGGIPNETNLFISKRLFLHDPRRAKFIAAMYDIHFGGIACQKRRFLHRRVSSTNNHQRLIPECRQRTITCCAGGHSVAAKTVRDFRFAWNPQPFC